MKRTCKTIMAGLALSSFAMGSMGATLIIGDDFNVTGSGTGFSLGSGVNSGIIPPITRLTGTMAPDLRYFKPEGGRSGALHYITNDSKLNINLGSSATGISLSPDGTALANYGPALNTTAATPEIPSVYDITIDISNGTLTGSQRASFGISSAAGIPQAWDFGIELYRPNDTDTSYTIQKRIDLKSNGGSIDTATDMASGIGVWGQDVKFLFHITDAGPESSTFNSRLELAVMDGGTTNWIYDTATDSSDLPFGWRFSGANRYIYYYVAGNAGPATYDNFAVTSISRPSDPEVRTWTGGGTDDNWSTGANWGGTAPNTGDWLVFGAAARQNNYNDIDSLLSPWLTFNTGGFVLSGNEWRPLYAITNLSGSNVIAMPMRWQGTAPKTWYLESGTDLMLAGQTYINLNGDHTFLGGGTLRIADQFLVGTESTANPPIVIADARIILDGPSAQINSRGGIRIGASAVVGPTAAELVLSNGASVTLTLSGAACRVGNTANLGDNKLIVDGSTFTFTGGEFGVPWTGGTTAEVVQVNSTISDPVLKFNRDGAGQGIYRMKNSTLSPRQILNNNPGGIVEMHFDNAILSTSLAAENNFMSGVDLADIQAGGLTIDAAYNDIVLSSAFSGVGGLTKGGAYSATLTGANSYQGNTMVQLGKLVLPTTQTNASAIQVADYAEFGVIRTVPNGTLTAASLNLGTSTLDFDLGALPNPDKPLMKVNALGASGGAASVTVNISGVGLSVGTIALIDYTSLSGGFTAFNLVGLPASVSATLVNNTANSSIDLNISLAPGLRWTGANGSAWDYGTQNWYDEGAGMDATYSDGQPTRFLDGASTGSVDLTSTFTPGGLTVNNSSSFPYVWSGSGSVNVPLLLKLGDGSLTRTDGSLDQITEIELDNGAYVANATVDADFSSVLTDASDGLGTFVKDGAGVLSVVSSSSTFDGTMLVQGGTLRIAATDALGATDCVTVVTNGASLDVNNTQAPHHPVIVSGEGVGGQGAIVNNTVGGAVQNNLTDVTMTGDTTFGCIAGSRWDIRVRKSTGVGPGLRANGFNLAKVGGGSLSISAQRHDYGGDPVPYWNMNIGDILVKEGSLAIEESVSLDNPEKAFILYAGTTVNFFDLGVTNPILRNIVVTNGNLTCGGKTIDTNVINGSITLDGACTMRVNGAKYIINGQMSGNASLEIGLITSSSTPGYIVMNADNTYTGDTTVTNSTLSGDGSIAGNLVMIAGGLAPGNGVGTFGVGGDATLAGTITMELAPGETQNSDMLAVNGTIAGGGDLVVLFLGANAPVAGEVFQLFNKGVTGFASVTLPDLSAYPGLTWDQSNLSVDGSVRVISAEPPGITDIGYSDGVFTFSGTGGVQGATYYIVTSPDVAAPMSSWVPVETNVFGVGGTFSFSTNIVGAPSEAFFRLAVP